MELTTERLILRGLEKADNRNLFKLFTENYVSTYEEHIQIKSIADADDYISFHVKNAVSDERTHYYFTINLRESQEFAGLIGFAFVDDIICGGVCGKIAELEFFLLEEFQKKGYMPEALSKILTFAFEVENLVKIFAQCRKSNVNSEKVMIKCGMKKAAVQPEPKTVYGITEERVRYEIKA